MNIWQEKAIQSLVNKGYDAFTASKLYVRAYSRLSAKMLSTGFDRHYEAYRALVGENNFIRFDIKNNRLYYVNNGIDVSTETFEKEYTKSRLSSFADKYDTIKDFIRQYDNGEITLNELNEKIKRFKKENQDYHKEGS